SSGGNAFSSRTASMIVQEHFPPAPSTAGLESGPLFGVQFSQLPCSDLAARQGMGLIGPKRSPLGLSADPGGFPLYKSGVVVGGVGGLADGVYGFDPNVLDVESDTDELIALAGTVGFQAPDAIRAERIFVDGTALRFSDAGYGQLTALGAASFAMAETRGNLVPVTGYYPAATLLAGTAYGSETSGVRASTAAEFATRDAFVLTDGAGANRYPIRAATDGGDVPQPLSAAEARAILGEAFAVMSRVGAPRSVPRAAGGRGGAAAARRGRGAGDPRGSLRGDEPGARAEPPAAGQPRACVDLAGRHAWAGLGDREVARRADFRHRCEPA